MSHNNQEIQQALNDIALIRRVLNQSNRDKSDSKLSGITLDANLVLQSIGFLGAFILALVEFASGNSMTETIMSGAKSHEFVNFGIGLMGVIISGLLIVLYFVLWRAAQHNGEKLHDYVERNFSYVHNLSLFSDLLVKFATLSLLMLAGKPQWVAPALMLFTGDYLLQGRFFTLPTRLSVCLGTLCIGMSFAEFFYNSELLVVPLAAFAVIAGLSSVRLIIRYRQQTIVNT